VCDVREALASEAVALYLLDAERGRLALRAVAGALAADLPENLDPTTSLVEWAVAHGRVLTNEGTGPALPSELASRVTSVAAVPVRVNGKLAGLALTCARRPGQLGADDVRLLELLAESTAAWMQSVELRAAERRSRLGAEHALRRLALLADAGDLLSWTLESYEPTLSELPDVIVPAFADWCAIDLAERDGAGERAGAEMALRRQAARHADPARAAEVAALQRRFPGWAEQVQRVVDSGHAELDHDIRIGPGEPAPDSVAMGRALGLVSVMVVPIQVRGLTLGAISFGTGPDRRGFRPSDLAVSEAVAARVGVAIERVLLYRETREVADAASRQTMQLRGLVSAELDIAACTSPDDVLSSMVDQARTVLRSETAMVTFDDGSARAPLRVSSPRGVAWLADPVRAEIEAEVRRSALPGRGDDVGGVGAWMALPLAGPDEVGDAAHGVVILTGRPDGPFTEDDQAIFMSIVHLASVALEKARLYQEVEDNERRLETLVDAAPLAIIELDAAGSISRWNRAARGLVAWSDKARRPVFVEATRQVLEELAAQVRAGERVVDVELVLHRHDGRALPAAVSAVALASIDDILDGTLLLVADITDRKRLEEQVLRSQRLEAVGQLAGGVAHDFNNLLTVVLGYADLLLARPLDDDARGDLEAIRGAGEGAARLTSQLLTISSRQVVQPEVIDPNSVLREIIEVTRRVIGEHIRVRAELGERVSGILIDPGYLEQVVLNLMLNARDAMPDGGELVVSTADVVLDQAEPAIGPEAPAGRYVSVTVADTGEGMTVETLEHCFEPFFTTKPPNEGSGLGLATVYGIARQSDAHVQVETEVGSGTIVRLLFRPFAAAEVRTAPVARPNAPGGPERVLVVEDDPVVRNLTEAVLTRHGYDVLTAASGPAALALVDPASPPVDLLVTDIVMPDMGGLSLADAVHEVWPATRVLFMSGHAAGVQEELSAASHRGQFLPKPFTAQDLVHRVRDILDAP